MRRFPPAFALVLAFAAASLAFAAEGPRPADGYFRTTTAVAPGVWLMAQPGFHLQPDGNVTVIEQTDGLVLVDAGGSPGSGRRLVAAIRVLSRKPVKAVIITHWHGDHPQGLSEILAAWPDARTIATRATQAHLRDPRTMNTPATFDPVADAAFRRRVDGFRDYAREQEAQARTPQEQAGWAVAARGLAQYAQDMAGAVTLAPAEGFDIGLDLPDETTPVEVRFLGRGNTDGDAVVWLPAQKVLVAGDLVVSPVPFGFGGYPADWIAVLERLAAYDFQVLIPGHGSAQADRVYLRRLMAALAEVRAQVAPLAAEGLDLAAVRGRLGLSAQVRDFVGDDPWLRRWAEAYWVQPIVASAYREARGEPIIQSLRGE